METLRGHRLATNKYNQLHDISKHHNYVIQDHKRSRACFVSTSEFLQYGHFGVIGYDTLTMARLQ
jgi:hypothetical protein